MAFLEIQFPTNISFNSVGGPGFSTEVISFSGGTESRNQNWSRPIERWNIAYGVKSEEDVKTLLEFFMVCEGKAHGFRFKNHFDFSAGAGAPGTFLGLGDGSQTTFQLRREYTFGGNIYYRKISKPAYPPAPFTVYVNNALVPANDYTVDYTTGIITFDTPPGDGLSVSAHFHFDVPMRFDTDELPVTLSTYKALSTAVPLVELKL